MPMFSPVAGCPEPPRARAEPDRLVRGDQRGSDCNHGLLERFGRDGPHVADQDSIAGVGPVWIVAGGALADEGEGFVPDDEGRLFAPFWRGSADKRLGRPGTGIDLTLAAKLAEEHGGRIVARNRADRSGAVFAVWLPLATGRP